MKKFIMTAMTLVLGCGLLLAQDRDEKKIKGSGKVVTRDVPVQSFDALSAKGVYTLILSQGSKEGVKIETDDNLQELFEVKNDGSKLVIGMKKNSSFDNATTMKVYVTVRNLKALDLGMVGATKTESPLQVDDLSIKNKSVGNVDLNLTAKKIRLENKSVGNINISGKADDATIVANGVGNINASNFEVQRMDIENNGVGNANVNAKELKAKDSFLGKVRNRS
jgi:hypothetical protein